MQHQVRINTQIDNAAIDAHDFGVGDVKVRRLEYCEQPKLDVVPFLEMSPLPTTANFRATLFRLEFRLKRHQVALLYAKPTGTCANVWRIGVIGWVVSGAGRRRLKGFTGA